MDDNNSRQAGVPVPDAFTPKGVGDTTRFVETAGNSSKRGDVTPDMIEAGVEAYRRWETDAVIDDGVSPYAQRELVQAIYLAMAEQKSRIAE